MSKTVEEIGLIVGGLALAAVPGLQAFGLITIAGHAALLQAMLGIGLSTALSGVGLALRQTPQTTGTANSISFSNGVSPRRVIYGQFQTAGVLTYASFPPSQNQNTSSQFLHLVYTLTGHEISSFDGVVVDGNFYNFGTDILQDSSLPSTPWEIHPAANPSPDDFYWQHLLFEFDAGSAVNGNQPFPNLAASDSAWTSAFLQQGCAKVHVICRYDVNWTALFPSGQLPNIQFLVTGKKVLDPRVTTAWEASTAFPQYSYIVDNDGVVWFQQSSGSPTSGSARPSFETSFGAGHTLTDGGITWYCTANNVSGIYGLVGGLFGAHAFSLSSANGVLVNDGWLPSVTYGEAANNFVMEAPTGYLQLMTANTGASGSTRPALSTTLGGTTTDGGVTWTCMGRSSRALNPSNSALCVNDYLLDTDAGMSVPASQIDPSSVIAAANVCEEPEIIIWNADNTIVLENLYSCNGMFDHSSTRGNVLTSLCNSMAGWVVPPGDVWRIFAGAYVSPTVTLDDDDLRSGIKGDFRISKREVANSIKGTYVPAFLPTNPGGAMSMTQIPGTWQSQNFPAYQANGLAGKPDYLNSEDGGQVIWQELQLDFTTSLWTAQRLAKIALMRLRFQETITLPCKLTAFVLEAGDTFGFTHARWSMLGAVFEIQQCSITFDNGKDGAPVVGVDITARQTDPSIYEFTAPSSSTDFGEYSPYGITGVMTGVE
jgi:hypothetical protein